MHDPCKIFDVCVARSLPQTQKIKIRPGAFVLVTRALLAKISQIFFEANLPRDS